MKVATDFGLGAVAGCGMVAVFAAAYAMGTKTAVLATFAAIPGAWVFAGILGGVLLAWSNNDV